MIIKEKLKVGKLYKVQNANNTNVVCYRVWLGEYWSMGTQMRCHEKHIYYTKAWKSYEYAIPVNLIASPFGNKQNDDPPLSFKFVPVPPKKPIRFLNRPEV